MFKQVKKMIAFKIGIALALVATMIVSSASVWFFHQPETPSELLK